MKQNITLMKALSKTFRHWEIHMKKCAMEVGIPDSYRMILMFLSRHPGANQMMIADFADRSRASVNQNVKKMIEDDYIRKEADEKDQRYTKLYLTEKGIEKAERLRARLSRSDARITDLVGSAKEQEIIALLELIRNGLKEEQ
ncbi:MAG: MarR family transcriptional regulator [Clostridia bacterium]|nr:MarR family transcriptional regulator [Clostridia bacterium]